MLRNPDGIYREQLGNYQYVKSQKVAAGYITYLPEEIAALVGGPGIGVGSSTMRVESWLGGAVW